MSLMLLFGLSLLAVPVLAGWVIITAGNRLASLNARCETAFADIDVHLKRRYDLIPGLTECVRGFAAHEARILGEVVEARKASLATVPEARQQVEATLGRRVGAVLSLAEKYPDLAASPHFRELRQELVATEERITASRRFYNLAIGEYNAALAGFPGRLVAARRRLAERRPYDLGSERIVLDEPSAIRF
jgi:LemA protein